MFKYLILFIIPFLAQGACNLETLTLEQKIGQLLIVHFKGEKCNKASRELLREAYVGGFLFFGWANTLSSPAQVHQLSLSLMRQNKRLSQPPLFIAIDQEGGRVNRLTEGFTQFPSAQAMGSLGLPTLIEQAAFVCGKELAAVGINMNFAPVVDVSGENGAIGDRSFGKGADLVAECGQAALKGYKRGKVISVLKHFPGHGGASSDSHASTPIVNQPELSPFQKLAPSADAIMTAHLIVPPLDPEKPATFSKKILTDLLRNAWGFQGVIISDSLVMKGITTHAPSYEEAALLALNAGCDLLCLGGKLLSEPGEDELTPADVIRIHHFLVQAVHDGKLPLDQVNAKVERIYHLKQKYNLTHSKKMTPFEPNPPLLAEIQTLIALQTRLSPDSLGLIGAKIWKNECGGKKEGLVSWNRGENFMSLGIGHFIWYPEGIDPKFDTAFPKYLAFVQESGHTIPPEINAKGAPWKSREAFLEDPMSPLAEKLRTWLFETQDLQAEFIVKRFMHVLHKILQAAPISEEMPLLNKIQMLTASDAGLFALIDYVNFKGDGLSPKEKYQGKGWGLYPVLQAMQPSDNPLESFKTAAIDKLEERVQNSDPGSHEARWLPGWKNRILSY